jgi:tRNA(Ile)-lysidine synthase
MQMPVDSLLRSLREFIHQHRLIERDEKIIVAVSGGMDSVVLLDALAELRLEIGFELAVAHFNHQLRGEESDLDEAFVRAVAKTRGLECYIERANTKSVAETKRSSIQETARNLRYDFFMKLRTSLGFHKVATAHHADDNAETMLFNLIRGAGVHGLSGIPIMNKETAVIRPLLFATREQITQYAKGRQLEHREDSSNAKDDYTRNFLRHQVIPQLQENINPNLTATLLRTSELFGLLEEYLQHEAEKLAADVIVHRSTDYVIIDAKKFHAAEPFLQEHLLLHTARNFANLEFDFSTVKTMLSVSHGETGAWCSLAKDILFTRNRNELILQRTKSIAPYVHRIEMDKTYEFDGFCFSSTHVQKTVFSDDPHIEYVDADAVRQQLVLRPWSEGDWFMPLGMNEKKKLSDFFIDEKIPLFEKQRVPILVSDGDIVWVCGKRLDDRFKISSKTTHFLKLEYSPRTRTS